jgi:hypothetical protein
VTDHRPLFDGRTFDPERDTGRLASQLFRVFAYMSDELWHTIPEVADAVEGSEAAVSARFRDLRKRRFGAHTVERRYVAQGLYQYRLRVRRPGEPIPEPEPDMVLGL